MDKNDNQKIGSLKWSDLEELVDLAEEVLKTLQHMGELFDDQGNYIQWKCSAKERTHLLWEQILNQDTNYLCFRENDELRKITFQEALNMSLEKIEKQYLNDVLPIARGIMRKDSGGMHGVTVSDEIPDEYLDALLALKWKENLKLWTMQFDIQKKIEEDRLK